MSYIAVVDYGVGNLKSVSNAFAYRGIEKKINRDRDELKPSSCLEWVPFRMRQTN